MNFTFFSDEFDDIDSLKNKKIKPIGEILETQILLNLNELIKNIKEKLNRLNTKLNKNLRQVKNIDIRDIISTRILTLSIKNFFNSSQICQILEETNPLSEVTHKRKISLITNSKQRANLKIREINETHYRRVCPIETVEGKNAGLIWSLAKEARINKYGFIETPFYL